MPIGLDAMSPPAEQKLAEFAQDFLIALPPGGLPGTGVGGGGACLGPVPFFTTLTDVFADGNATF